MTEGLRVDDLDRIDLLGMRITSVTRGDLVAGVDAALTAGEGGWIITANVDHVQRFLSAPEQAELYRACDLVVADGVPLLWAARLQGTPLPDRVAGSDLVWLLAERAALSARSLYLLGGAEGAAEGAAREFRRRWPELRIAGCSSPRISADPTADEIAALRAELAGAKPDLVFVALGAPKQERVIAALRAWFPSTWWVGVGISLSFVAGSVPRAPRWMQRAGVEWMHRLSQEPARLARRYLLQNLPFTASLLVRALRARARQPAPGG